MVEQDFVQNTYLQASALSKIAIAWLEAEKLGRAPILLVDTVAAEKQCLDQIIIYTNHFGFCLQASGR